MSDEHFLIQIIGEDSPATDLPRRLADPSWHGLDQEALTAAHCAVETELVELRDSRISVFGPANGFVVSERDGSNSGIMRLGTREGLAVGIAAYLECLAAKAEPDWPGLLPWLQAKGWVE